MSKASLSSLRFFSAHRNRLSIFQASQEGRAVSYGYDTEHTCGLLDRLHSHDDIEANLSLEHPLHLQIAHRELHIPPGRLALFWGGIPHRSIAVPHNAPFIWLTIPVPEAVAWSAPGAERLLRGEVLLEASSQEDDQTRFLRWQQDLHSQDPAYQAIARLEIEARLRRSFLWTNTDADQALLPQAVLRMLRYAQRHAAQGVSAGAVAQVSGLNPRWASKLFHQHCGLSVKRHLTRLRVGHAQRLLCGSRLSVLDIALAAGFGSLPACYRAFARELGCPPQTYRLKMSGHQPSSPPGQEY